MSVALRLEKVVKHYQALPILNNISLEISPGELVVVVGPSGCGKSTLLRVIAGLETINHGHIYLDNNEITHEAPKKRDIAMVFQNYALYPHMTVRENLSYGLKIRKFKKKEIERKVNCISETLKISHLLDRKPQAISGGQRQRVAMGRAMVREPALFLFDEPLSNLDAHLRTEMRSEIKRMQTALNVTSIYVTHDQTEAMTLADKVVILDKGKVVQIASPMNLYQRPNSRFVAEFMGQAGMNFFQAYYCQQSCRLKFDSGDSVTFKMTDFPITDKQPLLVGIRAEHFSVHSPGPDTIKGEVTLIEALGSDMFVYLEGASGCRFRARLSGETKVNVGDMVSLKPHTEQLHFFDKEQGVRLGSAS